MTNNPNVFGCALVFPGRSRLITVIVAAVIVRIKIGVCGSKDRCATGVPTLIRCTQCIFGNTCNVGDVGCGASGHNCIYCCHNIGVTPIRAGGGSQGQHKAGSRQHRTACFCPALRAGFIRRAGFAGDFSLARFALSPSEAQNLKEMYTFTNPTPDPNPGSPLP